MTSHDACADTPLARLLWLRSLPMFVICVAALLPWSSEPRSGVLDGGRYALALGLAGLLVYGLSTALRLDPKWRRLASVPLALGCLSLAATALDGYGALGAIVAAVASVAWLVAAANQPARGEAHTGFEPVPPP